MLRLLCVVLVMLASMPGFSQTVRFEIKSLPAGHPAGSAVFIAGSFNGWKPNDDLYRFSADEKGQYSLQLNLTAGDYEYKITRGSWDKEECRKDGSGVTNRGLKVEGDGKVELVVEGWKDLFGATAKKSTAGQHVQIIDTAFRIDQLNRKRRIWIYLPDGYASGKTRYPVLYMQDGQNVFDSKTSFAGEWGVDECLDSLRKKCIVVAIDNGGATRTSEYSPYDYTLRDTGPGKGEGPLYLDFLVKQLKPFIDQQYRTLRRKENTFIAGSSMGGLISMYALIRYPKIFGGAGVFSPSFWIAPQLLEEVKAKGKKVKARIYFYAGKQESASMVTDMLKVFEGMMKVSKSKMTTVIRDDGKHNEPTWRKEFPLFYKWILE